MKRRGVSPILVAGWLLAILNVSVSGQSALTWTDAQWNAYKQLPPVSVATDSTWPPMEYINSNGTLVGFDIDLLREIGRRSGFRPVFVTVPWDGIFAGLMGGHYQMIASSVTLLEERKRVMLFSEPYFTAAQYLVVPKNDRGTDTIEDLAGGEVGAQIGTTGSRLIAGTPGVTLRAYDDLGLAVEDLAQGRLAGIVADTAIVEYFVLAHERYGAILRVAEEPYTVEEYAFAIQRDEKWLQDAIDRGLTTVVEDGTYERFRAFWFPSLSSTGNERCPNFPK